MQICRVIGTVVATAKHATYRGWKLLRVQPVDFDGAALGEPFVAVDSVSAGAGDRVLVLTEGGSANIVLQTDQAPVASVIVAVVDSVDLDPDEPENGGNS